MSDIKDQFTKYLSEFLIYLQGIKNYSTLTIKTYNTPIKEAIEVSEIYEENQKIIFDIVKYRLKISKQNSKTINKKLSAIRSFIEYLDSKDIIVKLIGATSIKSAQTLPKPIQTKDIFEGIEYSDDQERLIVMLIYSFGIRISELSTLKLTDISTTYITVTGKGSKQRQIPSTPIVIEFISKYKKEHTPSTYLFEKNGKKLSSRQLQYRVAKVFDKIGIKVTPHQLRHSFATDLLNDGARINDISQLLGHSSLKATGIYTKLNTNTKLIQYNNAHPLNKI